MAWVPPPVPRYAAPGFGFGFPRSLKGDPMPPEAHEYVSFIGHRVYLNPPGSRTMNSESLAFGYALLVSAAQLLSYVAFIYYLGWIIGLLASFALALGLYLAAPKVAAGCEAAGKATLSAFSSLRARFR